ncbi:outer membrane protein assembly factor BamE [Pseudoduganella sp. RAF53_2]|uniref:outer membrane protein assembly factor BamE n=1 Tax=unclassified Pseudoduganella TaxID=2637179 RepID=UPI003F9839D6
MRVTPALPSHLLVKCLAPLAALALAGCASKAPAPAPVVASQGAQTTTITQLQKFMWFFSPYRPDIQQGNFVSQEMMAQLKVGMTKDQVKFLLGTPLMADAFHADRWDYPFRLAKGSGELTTSAVVVFFDKDGKVERFEGGNLPTEQEYISRIAGPIKEFKKSEAAADKQQASPARAPLPAGQESGAAK